MTNDKARKRQVRARMARTGEPYVEAARQVGRPEGGIDSVDGAVLPSPVALMQARHIRAAGLHLGAAHSLAANSGAPGAARLWEGEGGPVSAAYRRAHEALWGLRGYAERTAVSSGVIEAVPEPMKAGDPAERVLYPGEHRWCASGPGRTLPQPGEDPERDASAEADARATRNLLGGPVPETRLTEYATWQRLVKARDVVAGTPAAPIWQAYRELYSYGCDWMFRKGDAPGDLAAALEGCRQVLETVTETAAGILAEIDRRADAGTLTGIDTAAVDRAAGQMTRESVWPLLSALDAGRDGMDGARAELPRPQGKRVPDRVARTMDGRPAAEIRKELGGEVFINRHIDKVRSPDYTRADALVRILDWMHATGATVYDRARHASSDPALAEG